MRKDIYFENLDGLRFWSFFSVFLFHSFYHYNALPNTTTKIFNNGDIGVNFFFVLSGFLITYLLLSEKVDNGKIKLTNFWMRRVLRIWPVFYLCVFIGFVLFPFVKSLFNQISTETANPYYYIFFVNNFDLLKNGMPDSSILAVLWSVAVEEQFYLIWPIILIIFQIKRLWIPFSIVILGSILFRINNDIAIIFEHHTFSCIADISVGSLGAWLIVISNRFKIFIERLTKLQIFALYILFVVCVVFRNDIFLSNYFLHIFERVILALLILLIILEQCYSEKSIFKMSQLKFLSNLGKVTYGLYCYHFIGLLISSQIFKSLALDSNTIIITTLNSTFALLITIVISKMSYVFFERYFLRMKLKFK